MKSILFAATIVCTLFSTGLTQSTETAEGLKQYVPVLPAVRKQFFEIDPKLGYALKEVGSGVYIMSDNGWQSAFLVTEDGVILFDAPETFGA
ncbi:MAG: hypothetical protein JO170_25090, partial [Verrucomicrobia bacterium]|nr:hypothetical protein [Verrucomicrobiota bacterium]